MRVATLAAMLALSSCGNPAIADEAPRAMVTQVAKSEGVPPALAHGVVKVESRYRCHAKNPRSSALGVMQVLRGTAHAVGIQYASLRDCHTGLVAGLRYLKRALRVAGGRWCVAASLYERGTGAAKRCTQYGRRVIANAGAS